ncbi:MAG: D-aminoacyl-tRNA deacylase, partial [Nocardioides sp.]
MRAVLQRVLSASVTVDDEVVGALEGPGLLAYLGVTHGDGAAEVAWMARKIWEVRLLRDERSLSDVGGGVLVVSQFTLYGEARKGRRPTWG